MSSTVGVDYELATIVVQFQMAPDTMCRSFTILEDTEKEPVETFGVLLETSDPAVRLTDNFATVSIIDSTGISRIFTNVVCILNIFWFLTDNSSTPLMEIYGFVCMHIILTVVLPQ